MVDAGSQANFIDTQNSKLTNFSDSLTYTQLTDTVLEIDSKVVKHQLTNDSVDNVFSLYMNSVQGNMWVTNPEWAALLALTVDGGGRKTVKNLDIRMDRSVKYCSNNLFYCTNENITTYRFWNRCNKIIFQIGIK